MSASDVSSAAMLPQELNYQLPPALPNGWRSSQLRQQTISALPNSVVSGNEFQIQIPQLPASFLDPTTTYLNVRIQVTATVAANTDNATFANSLFLLGSGWSLFNRYEAYFNNSQLIDQIQEPGIFFSNITKCTLSGSQRLAMPHVGFCSDQAVVTSDGMGTAFNKISSDAYMTSAGTATTRTWEVDYCLPLLGVMGSNTSKLIPLFLGGYRLDLTADNFADVVNFAAAANLSNPLLQIKSLEFVGQVVTIDQASLQAVLASAVDQKLFIPTQSVAYSSQTLAASSGVGLYELLISSRVSSCKSVMVSTSISTMTEKKFGSCNPNATTGTCVSINGVFYPQQTLDPTARPMDCLAELQKSLNSLYSGNHTGCFTMKSYSRNSTVRNAFTTAIDAANNTSNNHILMIDTEVFGRKHGSLLTGVDTKSGSNFLRYQIGTTLAALVHQCNIFCMYDAILEVDLASRTIIRRM